MLWDTRKAVQDSLLEFTPALRARHHIVKLASGKWTRTLGPPGDTEKHRVVNVRGREWKQVPRAGELEREWWQGGSRVHHATKKTAAQLDREIAMANVNSEIDLRFQVGSLGYRLRVRRDRHRGGYEALLLTDGGPLMMPNGTSPGDAVARLVRELTAGDAFDRKIAREIVQRTGFPAAFDRPGKERA